LTGGLGWKQAGMPLPLGHAVPLGS
jgi:hypothetical protein